MNIIGAVHSGWKGTAKRIVDKTVAIMKKEFHSLSSDLYAFIAPAICQDNYEIGGELLSQFSRRYVKEIEGNFYLDLISSNRDMLIEQGIPRKNIEISNLCSFQENEVLHSYRREGKFSGRAFGVIGMKG
jgi:YfiH family protein